LTPPQRHGRWILLNRLVGLRLGCRIDDIEDRPREIMGVFLLSELA
jgi:hypothetical protein